MVVEKLPKRILYVDDDAATRYAMCRFLRHEGFEITEAADGAEALRHVASRPDLVILDVNLPDMDGFEVCKRIRSEPEFARTPVLMISATYLDGQSKINGLNSGADGYLTHPVEPPVLIAYVGALIRAREAEDELVRKGRQWQVTFDALSSGVCLTDAQGIIQQCNQAMLASWGTVDQLIGHSCEIIVSGHLVRQVQTHLIRAEADVFENDRWWHAVVDPVLDSDHTLTGMVVVMSDITERKQAEVTLQHLNEELEKRVAERTAALRESEERYRAIVEDQTELICRHLPDGTLTFANGAYCRYFDVSPDALADYDFFSFIADDDRAQVQEALASLGPATPHITFEHRVVIPDGQMRWLEWSDRYIVDEGGRLREYQAVGRDITVRKQAEETLRQALAREMEVNEIRSRFVSMASHDLRTPLAVIRSSSDILMRYSDQLSEEEQQKRFQRIQASTALIADMLDKLLVIEQSETGKLLFEPQEVDLHELCEAALDDFRISIASEHRLVFSYEGDCSEVCVDPRIVQHILHNLLSNAIKYSPDGSVVTLHVACEENQVHLSVHDEGIGIPEADQHKLFDPFHRAGNVGDVPGTGLGLTIVWHVVELHGGDISFTSEEGAGTTFTVTLPCVMG